MCTTFGVIHYTLSKALEHHILEGPLQAVVEKQYQVTPLQLPHPPKDHFDHVLKVLLAQRQPLLVEVGALEQGEEEFNGTGAKEGWK